MMRLASCLVFLVLAACNAGHAREPLPATALVAYAGGTVIPAPEAAPISDGVVLADSPRIVAVGSHASVAIPPRARVVDCRGATVLAAFWNAHVHFTERTWADAEHAPAARLEEGLRAMLTRFGFAHVFDTGSDIGTPALCAGASRAASSPGRRS
jgi:imidazolonepropionase-like amidohydrolase